MHALTEVREEHVVTYLEAFSLPGERLELVAQAVWQRTGCEAQVHPLGVAVGEGVRGHQVCQPVGLDHDDVDGEAEGFLQGGRQTQPVGLGICLGGVQQVPGLQVGGDVGQAKPGGKRAQFGHRHPVGLADVDAPQEGDAHGHGLSPRHPGWDRCRARSGR